MSNSLRQIAMLIAYLVLTFFSMRAFEWLHALAPWWHWLAFLAIGALTIGALRLRAAKISGVAQALFWGWVLATFWTHQSEVRVLQGYAGFGSLTWWTNVFWMLLLPLLVAFFPMAHYGARWLNHEPQLERFNQIAGLVLLQLVLWLLLVIALIQLPAMLALSQWTNFALLGFGFLLFLLVCSFEPKHLAVTLLGAGFALMVGSLAQLLQVNQSGWIRAAMLILILIILVGAAFYLGWVFRGRPEQESAQHATESELEPQVMPTPTLSPEELAEKERRVAEYRRRSQLSTAERVAEDFAQQENDLLAQAEQIRQQTPDERAAKLRAAIEAAEARDAADKWTRE